MPLIADQKVKARGGAKKYRTKKVGKTTLICAITRKSGPKGGKTVCWKR